MLIRTVSKCWLAVTVRGISMKFPDASAKAKTPDWTLFWAFPVAFAVAGVLLVVTAIVVYRRHTQSEKGKRAWVNAGHFWKWLWLEHLHVGAKWTLKDSWASNVTVIAAAFAGVFGSSTVVKALLGKEGQNLLGLTTVSAALAVGAVGAAPLLLAVFKVDDDVTPAGLLIGAAVTMGATGGELAIICLGVRSAPLGGLLQHVLWLAGLIGGGTVLACYAAKNMADTLTSGLRKAAGPDPRRAKGSPPRKLTALSELTNTQLQGFHEALAGNYDPIDVVASAYDSPVWTEPKAGVF